MKVKDLKKFKLSDKPGVYFFYKNKDILYIGKATSLRDRLKSYFGKDLINTRGPAILDMVTKSTSIRWQETDSVLEALILEANLIKRYQPKYNTKEKDNKSFNYVCITKEQIPKVLVIRGRNLKYRSKEKFFSDPRTRENKGPDHSKNLFFASVFGPYTNGFQLKEAMKIVRRIFPYIDEQSNKKNNKEFYRQLGLTPVLEVNLQEYKKNIKNLKLFFEGKKKRIILNLKKEMAAFSKSKDFENAARIRDQIFALNHINDVALIKEETSQNYLNFSRLTLKGSDTDKNFNNSALFFIRVEGYDIAHMSGKNMVGVMTVIENGVVAKSEYKKFIIRTQTESNDTGALEEVLSRRFRHIEWGLPDLIVMDGSTAQINIAKQVLNRYQFKIPIIAVVKDDRHKAKAIIGDEVLIKKYKKDILLVNNEAHRFAITFHKQKRNKNFLG